MKLIDDEGNLFGYVNVVDALVVLLVIAVIVAGLAVIGLFGGEEAGDPATRYATIDLGEQPEYVAEQIEAGDRMALSNGEQNITITDVHRSATSGGTNATESDVVVRAQVRGTLRENENREDPVFHFDGERFQVGTTAAIDTPQYAVEGDVTAVTESGSTLQTGDSEAVLETTVPELTANEIQVGDEFTLAGDTLATVETVQTYPVGDDRRRVHLGITLATVTQSGHITFAGRQVTIGATLGVSTPAYDVSGTVVRRGALQPRGTETTTPVELRLDDVDPDRVDGLRAGLTEAERGTTLATITSVESEPAEVILESEDGNIFAREHPTNLDVTLEADLATRQVDGDLRFHGAPLRQGQTVTLDFGSIQIVPEVAAVETA